MIRAPLLAACVLVLGVVSLARADASTAVTAKPLAADECRGERYLVLEAHGEVDERLVSEVRTDLATELDARGLAICHPAPSGAARRSCSPVRQAVRATPDRSARSARGL